MTIPLAKAPAGLSNFHYRPTLPATAGVEPKEASVA